MTLHVDEINHMHHYNKCLSDILSQIKAYTKPDKNPGRVEVSLNFFNIDGLGLESTL